MTFEELHAANEPGIREMSRVATEIVREHYDPIIGKEQNDYMLALFQSPDAIREQLAHGYRYFFVRRDDAVLGFLAFYPRDDAMYISKLYLYRQERGKGCARRMLDFVAQATRDAGLHRIELNVNKKNDALSIYKRLGFTILRAEKNDIGSGYFMDDYVMELCI